MIRCGTVWAATFAEGNPKGRPVMGLIQARPPRPSSSSPHLPDLPLWHLPPAPPTPCSDDDGMVKLFNYPCVIHDAPHRAYRGHSSHVMCVRFNSDSSLVCSVGGHDWAVFQFRVVRLRPDDPPPPKAEKVWGAIDDSGERGGKAGWVGGRQEGGLCWGGGYVAARGVFRGPHFYTSGFRVVCLVGSALYCTLGACTAMYCL